MTYAHWTTGEQRRMKEMHADRKPTLQDLYAAFERHSPASVRARVYELGLRRAGPEVERPHLRRLRIAHQYFSRREAGLLA